MARASNKYWRDFVMFFLSVKEVVAVTSNAVKFICTIIRGHKISSEVFINTSIQSGIGTRIGSELHGLIFLSPPNKLCKDLTFVKILTLKTHRK